MADLNTGTRNILAEGSKAEQREDERVHSIPGAFPGEDETGDTSSSPLGKISSGFPDEHGIQQRQQPQSLTPEEHKATAASKGPMTNTATSLGHGPSGHPIVAGIDDKVLAQGAHATNPSGAARNPTDKTPPATNPPRLSDESRDELSSHPTPPRQSEVGSGGVDEATGLQSRVPRQADGQPAPGSKGVGEVAVPIEESPTKRNDTAVKAGDLAKEVAQEGATAAVAGGLAAKDAALWTKDKAVENYPAARDAAVENATWAKDRAVENYPAVRDQTIGAASTAGNAAYSGAATAASTIASTAQAAYNATTNALPESLKRPLGSSTTSGTTAAPAVPDTVKNSLAKAGESPEAAASTEAVEDKRTVESELLSHAGSADKKGQDDEENEKAWGGRADGSGSREKTDVAPRKGAGTIAGVGALAGHMPNRTESTDFVKILGTETYKPHSNPSSAGTGPGAAAQKHSPAHGGGPESRGADAVTGSTTGSQGGGGQFDAILGQQGVHGHGSESLRGDSSYTHAKDELTDPRNDTRSEQPAGAVAGTAVATSMQAAQRGDNVPRTLQGLASQHQHQQHHQQPPQKTVIGDNKVKEVDYNQLPSGTQSGVSGTQYKST